ncbi:uncharacterized protein LOC124113921 isoform X2 [Haliotis rufescens]|uniref:uncharacterized protein LOC124113921 isoform X2 n=1 Tax=Haliotis rufescens TaxID=6454 RepID=UPI00201F2A60|nr:uncharacterized protein LOC124113921 isoform X2 [Haliotis rufescens]
MSGAGGSYLVSRGPLLAQLSALATQPKEGTSAILTKDAQSGQKSKEFFYIRGAGMPRSDNIAMSRSTLVKVSSLAMHSEEEGTLCQYGSLKSEDDFIMIDKGDKDENEQPLTVERASINTSIRIDSVQPLTSSVEAQDKRNDTGQCSKDKESQRVKRHGIASWMELTFSSDELEQMAQVADKQVVVPQLSIDQEVLVVIDKTNRHETMKLVGMADTINVLKETLNNLREMWDTSHKKNQDKQRSPRISTSILRGNRPRETSAQKQASIYQSMTSVPKEENPAPISTLLDNATSIQRDKKTQGTLTQEQPSLHSNVDDVLKKEESAIRVAIEVLKYKPNVKTVDSRPSAQSAVPFTQENQGLKVTVGFNRIEKQNADVIVNTTNRQLSLSCGFGVSYSLLKAAGSDIQTCLRHTYPNGIDHGDLAVGRSGNLDTCKKIYHGCLPFYKGFSDTAPPSKCYELLVSLVFRCLIQACKDGFQTIALPAFGTGALQYPTKNVVQLMYHAIDVFTQDERAGSLKEIFIVISRESRLGVKQLFLAHRLSHKLKTRHLANPRGRTSYLSQMFRLWFGTGQDFGLSDYLSQEIQNSPKCEVRIMVADTLVQAINVGVVEACDITGAVLLIWRMEDITNPNDHAGLTCINRDRHDWDCCREHVADLKRTSCVADTTTVPGTTLIHTYSRSVSEASVSEALQRGLRLAAKEGCYHVTVPLPSEGSLAARPDQSASAIASAINRRPCGVYVVTVIIPDNDIYVGIVTRIASRGIVQEPPDVDKVSLVDSLWKVTFSRQQNLAAMLNTAVDAVMVVTSDSEETNRNAARDVERELHVHLNDVVYSRRQ